MNPPFWTRDLGVPPSSPVWRDRPGPRAVLRAWNKQPMTPRRAKSPSHSPLPTTSQPSSLPQDWSPPPAFRQTRAWLWRRRPPSLARRGIRGGRKNLGELGRASQDAASAAEMLAAWRRPRAALSLFIHPAQFPWLRRHPPPPSSLPAPPGGGRGGRARLRDRASFVILGRVEAHPVFPLCSCATPAAPAQPPPTRQYPDLSPAGPGAGAPRRSSAAPGPAARGRGAAQSKLLSCSARSEVAAETAASRPLPGLGGSEHTPTRHHPLPALTPAAPA